MCGLFSLVLVWPFGWGAAIVGFVGITFALLFPSGETLKAMHEEDHLEMLVAAQTEAHDEIRQAALAEARDA